MAFGSPTFKAILEDEAADKSVSIDALSTRVRNAWQAAQGGNGNGPQEILNCYVREVYDDAVIAETGKGLVKVPWSENVDGEIEFGEPVAVEAAYVEVKTAASQRVESSTAETESDSGAEDKVLKPGWDETENQFRYRLRDPGDFVDGSFRTMPVPGAEGVQFVIGHLTGETTTTVQSVRFDNEKWTLAEAKKWVADHPKLRGSKSSFKVVRQVDGRLRFIGVVSNHYQDRDDPPEILAGAAHKDFIARCDAGGQPFPILCLWHEKGLRLGQADCLDYTDDGMVVISGLVDEDKERAAKALEALPERFLPLGMSHEFEPLERDSETVLRYNMREASVLPRRWAANEWTAFTVALKGSKTMFTGDKRDLLVAVLGEPAVSEYEASLKMMAQEPQDAGIAWKDLEGEESAETDAETAIEAESVASVEVIAEPVAPEWKERVDATDVALGKLAEVMLQVAASVKAIEDSLPVTMGRLLDERLSGLPRATLYRASQDAGNAVERKATPPEDGALPDNTSFWDSQIRGAFGGKGIPASNLGG